MPKTAGPVIEVRVRNQRTVTALLIALQYFTPPLPPRLTIWLANQVLRLIVVEHLEKGRRGRWRRIPGGSGIHAVWTEHSIHPEAC